MLVRRFVSIFTQPLVCGPAICFSEYCIICSKCLQSEFAGPGTNHVLPNRRNGSRSTVFSISLFILLFIKLISFTPIVLGLSHNQANKSKKSTHSSNNPSWVTKNNADILAKPIADNISTNPYEYRSVS